MTWSIHVMRPDSTSFQIARLTDLGTVPGGFRRGDFLVAAGQSLPHNPCRCVLEWSWTLRALGHCFGLAAGGSSGP